MAVTSKGNPIVETEFGIRIEKKVNEDGKGGNYNPGNGNSKDDSSDLDEE